MVKVPDRAEIAESARAGGDVIAEDVPITARAKIAPRNRIIQMRTRELPTVGKEDMTTPFVGKWP
jgi:hypothetical protein